MTTHPNCPFCRIAAGEIQPVLLHEDRDVMAFLDVAPVRPGHTLVIPRRHAADIWDIGRGEAGRLMEAVHDVAALLEDRLKPDGMTLFQANRPAGWQTVFHIHVHLVPRHRGDPLRTSWKPQAATEAELDEALSRIR